MLYLLRLQNFILIMQMYKKFRPQVSCSRVSIRKSIRAERSERKRALQNCHEPQKVGLLNGHTDSHLRRRERTENRNENEREHVAGNSRWRNVDGSARKWRRSVTHMPLCVDCLFP